MATFQESWNKNRSRTKVEKAQTLKMLLNKVTDEEDRVKLKELIKIYLDAHDFVSQVGLEIAKYGDKYTEDKK